MVDQFKDENVREATKPGKNEIRLMEEWVSTKRPKDPYLELKPLTEKVIINSKAIYDGESTHEIFQERINKKQMEKEFKNNQFL